MEQVALRLRSADAWTYLGGRPEAKKPIEVVVRAMDGAVLAATGESEDAPTTEPVHVPEGEGRRLSGHHFFARPAPPAADRLVTVRGL